MGGSCAHECSVQRGQKRAANPLKLELQVFVSCWTVGARI